MVVRLASSVLDLCRVSLVGTPGAVGEAVVVPTLDGDRVVAATTAAVGARLTMVVWRVQQPAGVVTRLADSGRQAGRATQVAIARGASYVTAFRTEGGNLKLISWDVAGNGTVTRRGDSGEQAGSASLVRVVAVSTDLFVTAIRTEGGHLKLIPWRLNANGSLKRLAAGNTTAERVSEIDLTVQRARNGGGRLVSVMRTDGSAQAVKLVSWDVLPDGGITRVRDSGDQAGSGTLVRVVTDTHGNVVTAARVGLNVEVANWRLSGVGSLNLLRKALGPGDTAFPELLLALPDGVVCATRAADGRAKLAAFSTNSTGGLIRRTSDSGNQAESGTVVGLVATDGVADAIGRRISTIALVRTSDQTLRVSTWGPACVRLHLKILTDPNVAVGDMLAALEETYASVGIRVQHLSTERLSLTALEDVDVGECRRFGAPTADQSELFANRNDVEDGDVVVYLVRSTVPPSNGCASHPAGRPGAVVARIASRFTLAHEVGHVLGLGHIDDNNRLMTLNGTANITNPPPDLVAEEASVMQVSALTDVCREA